LAWLQGAADRRPPEPLVATHWRARRPRFMLCR
jgi:hypothetical protein